MTATPSSLLAARYDACSRPAAPLPPESDAERMAHIEHIANHSAPIPADEALWLLSVARKAISERDELQDLVSTCADTIADASDTLEAAIAATDYTERTTGI